jgi:hypothetical protein
VYSPGAERNAPSSVMATRRPPANHLDGRHSHSAHCVPVHEILG